MAAAHPAVGGKGLPPPVSAPVYAPSSPATSTSGYPLHSDSAPYAHHAGPAYTSATTAGPPPDLTVRLQLKARYLRLQAKYNRAIEARKDLTIEAEEKEATQQRLQDEVDLILDQIHDSDHAHLRPKRDSLFSDDENDLSDEDDEDASGARVKAEEEGATEGRSSDERKGKRKADDRDLNELELERRKELEAHYGVDGSRRNVSRVPTPPRPVPSAPAAAPAPAPTASAHSSSSSAQPIPSTASAPATSGAATATETQPPAPKRLKLTFGGGGGGGGGGSGNGPA